MYLDNLEDVAGGGTAVTGENHPPIAEISNSSPLHKMDYVDITSDLNLNFYSDTVSDDYSFLHLLQRN